MGATARGGGLHTSRGCERIWCDQLRHSPGLHGCSPRSRQVRLTAHAGRCAAYDVGRIAMWNQIYNPLDNAALSTVAAAIPVVTRSEERRVGKEGSSGWWSAQS